jgi:cytochrome c oxidase subunit 4
MTEPADMEPAPSPTIYIVVWLALVVLATATLLLSFASTDGWGMVIALAIASLKAALVMGFFMHLAYGRPVHRLVIAVAIAFVILIIVGVLGDVGTRSVASPYVDLDHVGGRVPLKSW